MGALLHFLNDLAAFVCVVISNIIEKIGYAFARQLACLVTVSIASSTTHAASQFKLVIDHLVKQQHLEGRSCDELIRQYVEFVDSVVRPKLPALKEFDFHKHHLDEFLQQHVAKSGSFPKLWDVMRMGLILSHGQASVEKAFSVYRQLMVENPLAWPGVRGERVLYQPLCLGRESSRMARHPWREGSLSNVSSW